MAYRTFFGKGDALYELFSPYRVCPLGAHVDHQKGIVSGFAFDKGIDFLFSETESGKVEFLSLSFEGLCTFSVNKDIDEKQGFWGDYLRGACWALLRDYHLDKGVRGILRGTMPIGGLSSSAALLCGFVKALARVNNITLTQMQVIEYASLAEREYIGLTNGILDQACVVLCEKDKLLYLDTQDSSYELIPFGGKEGTPFPASLAIFFSGVTRKLTGTDYNLRVSECKMAAWMVEAYEDMPLKDLSNTFLRNISSASFEKHENAMPMRFANRARHFYTECNRVDAGLKAWKEGDITKFGQLMFESCQSSIDNYECGSPELITLYEIMKNCPGIYGGRFSGAGFKGACIALVDSTMQNEIEKFVTNEYIKRYPEYSDTFECCFCATSDGVDFL
nr:galactokinase family protein [uncultured Bacteroides sp.]